jgi:hypothetical protein
MNKLPQLVDDENYTYEFKWVSVYFNSNWGALGATPIVTAEADTCKELLVKMKNLFLEGWESYILNEQVVALRITRRNAFYEDDPTDTQYVLARQMLDRRQDAHDAMAFWPEHRYYEIPKKYRDEVADSYISRNNMSQKSFLRIAVDYANNRGDYDLFKTVYNTKRTNSDLGRIPAAQVALKELYGAAIADGLFLTFLKSEK